MPTPILADMCREWCSPEEPWKVCCRWEPDAPHTEAGCVAAANICGCARDQFEHAGGATCEVLGQPAEVVQKIVRRRAQLQAVLGFPVAKVFLQGAKQPSATGDSQYHAAELAEKLVPMAGRDPGAAARYGGQDVVEPVCSMGW